MPYHHLGKDESVLIKGIGRICPIWECTPSDILEISNNVTEEISNK